ncbi:MAG: fibronectin type III domain-containing protein, partial [Bacteroidales bacterium]|nr:fibronectin type III domain-containing protein [Bacteroidales bacterium]
MASCPSGGQHKWYATRRAYWDADATGWDDPAPLASLIGSKTLQIMPGHTPTPGSTIRFNYPECQNPLPAFLESEYSVGKTNTDNSFTATLTYKNEAILEHGLFDVTSMGTIVAISSASPEPDFTLTNGTFYLKGYQFPESEGFVPTVLCNRMPYLTYGTPSDAPIYISANNAISVTLSGLTKMDSRYIHIFRMSLNCDGKPVYSPLCFTIAREPILDPPALLETVGMPTINSVKLHVKPAEGASVMIVKSPTSINVSPKGQLKKGSKIGDAEVVDILNEEKTFDVPMKAGEGCYFLAITVNTSNPNKYAYSPANRLWVPARAAYNGFPGLLDMSKELCGIPNKENDGMKLTTQEFKTLEPNIYRDMPFGWTRDLTLANGEKQVAFGLGHPGYSINVPVALYATAIYTKACKTDAITVPILADKNRILVTYEMQLWKADASGFVDKANAEDNDKFQLQYALGNGTWQEMTSWTGKTLPAADENGVYKLTYSLVNDNLTGQYIRFRFVLNSVTRNNSTFVAIRAVEIKEDKVCKAPTDLTQTISQTTTTQFPITWNDPNPTQASSYLVSYKRAEAAGDWTEKTVNTNSATLTGLRSSTTYLVRVSANCGTNGESYPSDTAYFTTAYTFPYTEAMAQRDTMFKIQGSNATVPLYSPFPGKSMYPALVRRDGGVNTYTGQLPVTGNNGTADLELASGDGSNAGVFSHSNTYYNKADIKMDDGYGVVRKQLKAVGVSERANYTWLITPVIYTVNLEEDQPITVRFRARSAKRVGGAGNPWTKGTVGDKYSAASLKVLVSNDGQFRNSDVIGTVNVGSDNIDS